ncbi:polysaccharide deacetylase family protein [Thermosediminibacter litoriperuensis]|uniref:Peptidoglycan/xylan/chitin deacetylase (PgdA/CDA1 family) n=1 Tax=Thermosediminibacter litoriperuensis TaxID=291989 RepID=A0A5S5ATA3_9FIRM|nr:polysaccharide deacetylase family protein [Thermosediminibacter litoriperuensis]TYP55499.1 peptidoglycan/xylan/chitin deacetylase (PgdA/CDA1 family) [Thermosediminibacter litoriperuensis]
MGFKSERGFVAILVLVTAVFGIVLGVTLALFTEGYLPWVMGAVYSPGTGGQKQVFPGSAAAAGFEDYYTGELNTLLAKRLLGIESSYSWGWEKRKIAYLTFDDGPSANTGAILEVLDRYGVKATFFVNGWMKKDYAEMYRKIYEAGHGLGNHTYSHRYELIYSSVENFMADLKKEEDMIYEAVGIRPRIIRFPGGSDNKVSARFGGPEIMKKIVDQLKKEGYIYVDWNASTGDALKPPPSKEQMMNYVRWTTKGKDPVVLLMHDMDSKKNTVEILPRIIEYLREEGYEFRVIDENIENIDKINRTKL